MRYCVFGAGAIGGLVAARLHRSGVDVSVVARGRRLDQVRADGLLLRNDHGDSCARITTLDADAGEQDVVFVALKAHAIDAALPDLKRLIGPRTVIVPLINGVPWWYFQNSGGRFDGDLVKAVDASGAIAAALPAAQIVGAVVYITAELASDGRIMASGPKRLMIGEIDDSVQERTTMLANTLSAAGITTEVSSAIRNDAWSKIALNLATNPISVIAGATLYDQFHDPLLVSTVTRVLHEAKAVAVAHGAQPTLDVEAMLELGRGRGHFYTSMLQDFRRGLPLELGAIGRSVLELAAKADVPMPTATTLVDLADRLARSRP